MCFQTDKALNSTTEIKSHMLSAHTVEEDSSFFDQSGLGASYTLKQTQLPHYEWLHLHKSTIHYTRVIGQYWKHTQALMSTQLKQ